MNADKTTNINFDWKAVALIAAIIVIVLLYFKSCGKEPSIVEKKVYVADSAMKEEIRRVRDSARFYKQYKWKSDILLTQREELEGVIVQQTATIVKMERELKRKIVVTDSADCQELANQVNDYIDTSIKYREMVDIQAAGYEAALMFGQLHIDQLTRYLDSCRGAINAIAPVMPLAKPRGQAFVGLGAATNLGFVFGGPEIMYKTKRDKVFRIGYGIGNSKPWYSVGYYIKIGK